MPTYEYKCTICDERFEVEQSIKAKTLTTIAGDDHKHTVKKVFHAPGIAFKGDGFYKNDARGKKAKAPTKTSDSTDSSSGSTPSTSSSSDSSTSTTSEKKSEPTTKTPDSKPAAKA